MQAISSPMEFDASLGTIAFLLVKKKRRNKRPANVVSSSSSRGGPAGGSWLWRLFTRTPAPPFRTAVPPSLTTLTLVPFHVLINLDFRLLFLFIFLANSRKRVMSEVLHSHFIDGAHNVLIIIKVKVGDFRSWTPSVVEIVVFTD